ncbi:phage holin family protein [Pseudonocardia broussonetiae]|uniref:Phage holin family protein n=1 Tax=Pseudonocardia broussonetiae TaxID=2736640 RepID=A0A6M6JKX8_9PSEU|nr:phage holin family protein [Pseudonocardia broussonetiae]QJY48804.1 phage holin family protein [Pseudonocardia broussonetiae]
MSTDTTNNPRAEAAAPPGPSDLSTGELVTRLAGQVSELVRGELELARTELANKGKRAGAGAGLAGAGGVVALYGGGALVAAAVAGLATVLDVWLAALVVGIVLLVVAGVLALLGRSQIRKALPPVPEDAVDNVGRDVDTVKQAVRR